MELWVYLQNDKIGINITHCHVLGGGIIDLVRVTSIGCSIDRGALQCPSTLYPVLESMFPNKASILVYMGKKFNFRHINNISKLTYHLDPYQMLSVILQL